MAGDVSQRVSWRTGHDIPLIEERHRASAAWALDRSPDSATWDGLTAHYRTPDQIWLANRVAEAFARFERECVAEVEAENARILKLVAEAIRESRDQEATTYQRLRKVNRILAAALMESRP